VHHIQVAGESLVLSLEETSAGWSWQDITILETSSGSEPSHITVNGQMTYLVLSPDGRLLAARDPTKRGIRVWDTETAGVRHRVPIDGEPIRFSPDGERLIVRKPALWVIDLASGETIAELGEPGGIWGLYVGADPDRVVTRGVHGSYKGWDLLTGELVWETGRNHKTGRSARSLDGALAALNRPDIQRIEVLDDATGTVVGAVTSEPAQYKKVSSDGRWLLAAYPRNSDGSMLAKRYEVVLWDLRSGAKSWQDTYSLDW
jgi:WD40 repeat protein